MWNAIEQKHFKASALRDINGRLTATFCKTRRNCGFQRKKRKAQLSTGQLAGQTGHKDSPAIIAALLIPKSCWGCWSCWSCLLRGRQEAGGARWTAASFNPHSLAVTPLQVLSYLQQSHKSSIRRWEKKMEEERRGGAGSSLSSVRSP